MADSIPYHCASEKDLEDWAEQHMAPLIHPCARLLGRQVQLPSGKRLDLLFDHRVASRWLLTVVELKAEAATVDTVLQCLGYVNELRKCSWDDYEVRGVVAAPRVSDDAMSLIREMRGMAWMSLRVSLTVTSSPLYDERFEDYAIRPPDVDATRPSPFWIFYEDPSIQPVRRLVAGLVKERVPPAMEWEAKALVPLSLTPLRVAYPTTNGKH